MVTMLPIIVPMSQSWTGLREIWRQSIVLEGVDDPIDSALLELSLYFGISEEEVRQRCLNWEQDSVVEWEAADRSTPEGLREFYHTTQSWIFDTVWYHARQYHGDALAESVVIAERLAAMRVQPGNHLDFGSGPGSTSLFFQRLGWQVALADISTTLLDFARWRFGRRGLHADFCDLNEKELPQGCFDLITACDVIAHVPDPSETLRQLHRALRPGGLLIFNIDARPKSRENQWHLYERHYPILRHVRSAGFNNLPRIAGRFYTYRKIGVRSSAAAAVVQTADAIRFNRFGSIVEDRLRAMRRGLLRIGKSRQKHDPD